MDHQPTHTVHTDFGTGLISTFTRGEKFFELTNHLGNVLVTISDKKIAEVVSGGNVTRYKADVISASDYYPFGMVTPGRSYSSGTQYRYGFNGKENDNEVKGTGNQQDYGMRIYDPRTGRFLSVDPLTLKFAYYTPYQYAGYKPIWASDLDGMEEWMQTQENLKRQFALIQQRVDEDQKRQVTQKAAQALANQPVFKSPNNSFAAQQRKQEVIRNQKLKHIYNSEEGTAFQIVAGVGGADSVTIPEAGLAVGIVFKTGNVFWIHAIAKVVKQPIIPASFFTFIFGITLIVVYIFDIIYIKCLFSIF